MKFYEYAEHVLSHGHSVATLGIRGLTADEATTVNEVLTAHAAKMQGADAVPHNVVKAFLKPLYVKAAVAKLDELEFEIPSMHYPTLQSVLSSAKRLERDHSRTIEDNKRILKGLSHWPMDRLKRRGVVCYERALERLNTERPDWAGVPTAAFMHRLVHTDGLPTLTGGCADHYVLVSARAGPRWLTVEELARAMEIHATSSLMRGLTSRDIKPAQAGEALGNGIHGACSRAILGPLIANGTLGPGMTYGSAWAGVDTFAASVEAALDGKWEYAFASEKRAVIRTALMKSWGGLGLTRARCHEDAAGWAATHEQYADLWVASPECDSFSKKNRVRKDEEQDAAMKATIESFSYVEHALPKVVVVENVNEARVVGPMSALLGNMARSLGYRLSGGPLDARADCGALATRDRHFWVMVRADH